MREAVAAEDVLGPLSPPPSSAVRVDLSGLSARVLEARKRRGFTGEQLGEIVGLGKDQVSKIETGKRRVSARELPRLAAALGVPIGYLLGESVRPKLALAHRLVAGADPAAASATRQRALQILEVEDVLAQRAEPLAAVATSAGEKVIQFARGELSARPRNQAEAQRQGRRLAEFTRETLGLGANEIGDLPGLIERNFGVDVAISPLGEESDGLCVHGDGVALLVASSDFSDGHVRFTLAHELGHHVLGDPRDVIDERESDMFRPDNLAEKRVNAFAAQLLMPEKGVRETLAYVSGGQITERALVALMERFGVSLAALVYELTTLHLMTFEEGMAMRASRVSALVARHSDVAPTGAATVVRRAVRAPERLLAAARTAARAEVIGLAPVATLLDREDDDALWREVMVDEPEPVTSLAAR